jgi:hypothetical protein
MKTLRIAVLAALFSACDFDVPDLNHPALESLQTNPTPSAVEAVATGLLIGARKGVTERVGLVAEWGILGREALVLTPSDPRFVSELLQGSLSPGSNNFGGNFWVIPYSNIRGANLLLNALDNPVLVGLTDAQKQALRGFAKTIQALDYLQVINSHDVNGAALDVNQPIGTPSTIVTDKDAIYTFIEKLLDDGKTSLAAGGTAFPFPLGAGFAGFDTPATFLKFNRALRARVAVYHGKFTDAIAALGESFLDKGQPLTNGVFHFFGSGSGDLPNDLNTPDILVHPSVINDADPNDDRIFGANAKVKKLAVPVALSGHSSQYVFTLYPSSTSMIPIIRNEELILLRAEANIGLGNIGNGGGASGTPGARSDINFIRQAAGLNNAPNFPDAATALDELLNQKRYSLLFESGHRWIDLRRYGKLDASHVAIDTSTDVIHAAYPIPSTEVQ